MLAIAFTGVIALCLGIVAHGILAHVLIFTGFELAKNSLVIMALKTKTGRGVLRFCKWVAYTKLGRRTGRFIYFTMKVVDRIFHPIHVFAVGIITKIKSWF